MAEELGAEVHTWRHVSELSTALEVNGIMCQGANNASATQGDGADVGKKFTCNRRSVVVLLDAGEARVASGPLAACIAAVPPERHDIFALPTWLSETYRQRRPLLLEGFAALTMGTEESEPKRQRLDEAMYAWQPVASTRLIELSEDSRARAIQSQVQEKENEGLRLAELRQDPNTSRLGG